MKLSEEPLHARDARPAKELAGLPALSAHMANQILGLVPELFAGLHSPPGGLGCFLAVLQQLLVDLLEPGRRLWRLEFLAFHNK